jgi:phospholipid/cholesterol/gamma-HCH transport system permease protein
MKRLCLKEASMETTSDKCDINFDRSAEGALLIKLAGSWEIGTGLPSPDQVQEQLESTSGVERIAFDTKELARWDTGLLTFLRKVIDTSSQAGIETDIRGLPEGARKLLALASAVPAKKDAGKEDVPKSLFFSAGESSINFFREAGEALDFVGEATLSFLRLFRGKARFRRSDLTLLIQECGAQALPIVTLISVLVGMILAFLGAVQLQMFGAEIYVANLVGIGMARELAPLMAAIIMAGRTGGAYAAQLGTMQVNEEIDALITLGFSPMDFLVLPRLLALFLMMPLLCLYADLMGIVGGALVGVGLLDLSLTQFLQQLQTSVGLTDFGQGVFKSAVFGVLIAVSGCFRGIQCGRSASAVGSAATSAVVMGIVLVVVSDAIIDVVIQILGI